MTGIGALLASIDGFFRRLVQAVQDGARSLAAGPLQGVIFGLVLTLTGVGVVVRGAWSAADRAIGWVERALIVVVTLGMTALVFDTYLIEQSVVFVSAPEEEAATPPADRPPPDETAAAPAPAPAPTPPPARGDGPIEVVLTGDGTDVSVTGEAGTFALPGVVPPGLYTATVSFSGYDAPLDGGELDIAGPGPIEVKCSSFAESCRVRRGQPPPTPASAAPVDGAIDVTLTGDGTDVTVSGDAGVFALPGPVPPGLYTATVSFPGYDAPLDGGELDIAEPGPIEVKCSSFAESCRVRKARTPDATTVDAPAAAPIVPATPADRVAVSVRGGGTGHKVVGLESVALPAELAPGSYVVRATFPEVGEVNAGSIRIEVGSGPVGLWCTGRTWQCLPDQGWWNPWQGEGQMNIALMLMVALGFLGASIATQDRNHLSVDAVDRVLSPAPARFVKRVTATVAAGFCAVMTWATWARITDPDATGDTFPGAKVWWWMVEPINLMTSFMPGDKFGPGASYPTRSAWEEAMIADGLEWPFGLAFESVGIGSGFPLWIPLLVLAVAFAVMGVRFAAIALSPPAPPLPDLPRKPRPGTRKPVDVIMAGAFPGAIIALGLAVWLGQGWMIIVASLLLVFMGAPLFIGVGIGTLAGWMLIQDTSATSLVSDMFEATKKQEIIAIPFFVLAGNLMTHGSIARRLIDFARAVVGPLPGGLAVAGVVACAIFAAISGSSPATVIAIGSVLFPMLVKQGYSESFSLGLLSTSGGLGIIIPPSVPMIIFAVMVSNPGGILGIVSPTDLFLGGIGPGLLIAGALIVYSLYANWPRPGSTGGPQPPGSDPDDTLTGHYLGDLGRSTWRGIASLMLPVLVLGGIYGHMFGSPFTLDVTQAAAFAVVYALVVEVVLHRELKLSDVPKVCIETASMIGSLFLILVIAISLNKLLAELEVPQMAAEAMLQWADDPIMFLLLVNIFLLLLGTVMDIVSAILIVAPLLAPIAAQYGIHPIHFGIMFIVNLELGYLTPPMGINLFVASTTFKRSLVKVIRGVLPFLFVMLACLFLIIWIPRLLHSTVGPIPGLPALLETQIGVVTADGPRDAREVNGVVRRELGEIRACKPESMTRLGSAVIELVVGADGRVKTVTTVEQDLEGEATADCLERRMKRFEFDPLPEGITGDTTARVPIGHVP